MILPCHIHLKTSFISYLEVKAKIVRQILDSKFHVNLKHALEIHLNLVSNTLNFSILELSCIDFVIWSDC